MSCTLDLAHDYWCAGAMAELMGNKEDATMFGNLAQNNKNSYDPSTGFMRPKNGDGKWRASIQARHSVSGLRRDRCLANKFQHLSGSGVVEDCNLRSAL